MKAERKKKILSAGVWFSHWFFSLHLYQSINGRRACNGLTQPDSFFVFFFNVFIYFFVFMLLSDAKRDVLRFATGAFACAVGRSEPLESDWKDLFPALFNYVSLDAEARLPSKQGEKERRGRRGQRSTVTSWDVNRFGGWRRGLRLWNVCSEVQVQFWQPQLEAITFNPMKFNPLW